MATRKSSILVSAILSVGASVGVMSACAPAPSTVAPDSPAPVEASRSNYIVSLAYDGPAPTTPELAAEIRLQLDADRDRVLSAVFGADAPPAGASFVTAYAFEIRLTSEQAARLAAHASVIQIQADQLHRPMGSGRAG